jgi:hypothetical protein
MVKGAVSTSKRRMQFRFMGIALEKLNLLNAIDHCTQLAIDITFVTYCRPKASLAWAYL